MSKWNFSLLRLLITINFVQSQTFQSIMTFEESGTDFIPANPIELIESYTNIPTMMLCYTKCNMNPLCRTFVGDSTYPFICRLYQGSIDTGSIVNSLSSTSRVFSLYYDVVYYQSYNQVCNPNVPAFDRYLVCINRLWTCPSGTYWNDAMCLNQVYYESLCNTNEMCREDIGLTCSSTCNKCLCNSTAIWNSTSCVASTCPSLLPSDSSLTALWLFNGDVSDSMNNYNGTMIGTSSFTNGYVGQSLVFSADSYVQLPYINFYQRSFTIELWIYMINTTYDASIFGQCPSLDTDQCLHIGMNIYSTLHFGFWQDDTDAVTTLFVTNQWYHVAFVYDYDRRERLIYVNGLAESLYVSYSDAPHLYLGQSGDTTLGKVLPFTGEYIGYIDHVSINYRAKTANEILDDATLVAYYSFDCGSILDSGPNLLHGSANGQTFITGRNKDAIQFNSLTSYFQASGFTALGMINQSFSISLWIKPLNVNGTLIHLSTISNGTGTCMPILGFSMSGNIIARIPNIDVYGPILPINIWTHIIYTFSVTNGINLYINGTLYGSSNSSITRDGPNLPFYITIANQLSGITSCISGNINNMPYAGGVDELRIYSREINASEICLLSS
ncbi:unnamed protein product [Adineta steineri]|uniref:Uncharacterized protein n=1 Tax=Adineta steineri TaxID=433720 RepID=A0A814MJM8_9BILA|nr:unnamed protein product [Adineta steineri]